MSRAKSLLADNYRWASRDGKCCGICRHMGHTIILMRHPHWCQIHKVREFPHLRLARVAPWMVCDKFKAFAKGGKA